jgi:hypothetical protein
MRARGVSGFPDPVSSLPSSPVALSLVFGLRGAVIAIPSTINPQSPKFKQDATVCRFPGASAPVPVRMSRLGAAGC